MLAQLNRAMAQHGLQYAPDPVTVNRATIGGGIGNNTCGAMPSIVISATVGSVVMTARANQSKTGRAKMRAMRTPRRPRIADAGAPSSAVNHLGGSGSF